jgi:hypothetical protein
MVAICNMTIVMQKYLAHTGASTSIMYMFNINTPYFIVHNSFMMFLKTFVYASLHISI